MRSVLITGTSTGIGRATAVVLASRDWRVFATMRNLQKRSLLEQARKESGVGAFARLNHVLRGKIPSRLLRKATRMFSRSCDKDGSEVDT